MAGPITGLRLSPSPEDIHSYGRETVQALGALNSFTDAPDTEALWQALITYVHTVGANLLSYHHQTHDSASIHKNVTVYTHGYPAGWVEHYIEKKQHLTDPLTQVYANRIHPTRWSDLESLVPLKPAQIEYLEGARKWMKGDGFGIPVFGPRARNGYVGIGNTQDNLEDWDALKLHRLRWVMGSFHVRWCEIVLMGLPADFTLDGKEMRVLTCLSKGMSEEDICGVMSASLESVQRLIRSLFEKMDVSDKASAVLRGVGAGLLSR